MNIIVLEATTYGLGRLAQAAKELGVKLYLLTHDRTIYSYELGRLAEDELRVVDVDTFSDEAIWTAVNGIPDIVGVLNLTDTWCFSSIKLAERLAVPCQNLETMRMIRNKWQLRNHLHENMLTRSPAVMIPEKGHGSEAELKAMQYPVMIKDASGTGSRFVWKANDVQEALDKIDEIRNKHCSNALTIEPFFEGTLYSIETVTWKGVTKVLAITGRIMSNEPYFREEVLTLPVTFDGRRTKELEQWIVEILSAVNYSCGFAHSEFILTADGPELVEINGRMGGGVVGEMLCRSLGINVYKALIEMAIGRTPSLFDMTLTPRRGFAQHFLYADKPGIYYDKTLKVTGPVEIFSSIATEKDIKHIHDYRGLVAILLASGHNTEEAIFNSYAAVNRIAPQLLGGA